MQVTLNIKRVDTGGKIYVVYKKVAVTEIPTATPFIVATRSLSAFGNLRGVDNVLTPIAGGLGQALAGSGETEVSPEVVAIGTKVRTATFKYTARAAISAVNFTLARPADSFPVGKLLVTGNANKAKDNYVRFGTKPAEGTLTVDGNTITVTGLKLAKNASFTIVIEDLEVSTVAANANMYPWDATLGGIAVVAGSPIVYVVQRSNNATTTAVTFEIVGDVDGTDGGTDHSIPPLQCRK